MADGNSDLFAAFDSLKTGIQEYQQTQAVKETRQQLDAINAQGMKEEERSAAVAQLGQGLALRLTGAHAKPEAIQAAISTLTPSASEAQQTKGTQTVEAMKTQSAERIEGMKAASGERIEDKKVSAILGKLDAKDIAEAGKKVGDFANQPQVKPILAGLPKLKDALMQLEKSKGEYGATAVMNLAQLGLIRNSAGRVNVQEILGTNPNQSTKNKLWYEMGLQTTGEAPQDTQQFYKKVIERSIENSHAELHNEAEGYSQSLNTMNPKIAPSQMSSAIHQRYGIQTPKPNPNQASIDAAKAWITQQQADPKTANNPDIKAVQEQIKKLGGQP